MAKVVIDCFPSSASRYRGYAIIAIDVIRATTTAVTAASLGWRCLIASGVGEALAYKILRPAALLAGETGGEIPHGFEMNNSPAQLSRRSDSHRPLILLSTSGTRLMLEAAKHGTAYIACLRNGSATATYVAGRYENIAIIGAGSRSEFREEDQFCCARLAQEIVRHGYDADDPTLAVIERWREKSFGDCCSGRSVAYLRRSNQLDDLHFIASHINDLDSVFLLQGNEVFQTNITVAVPPAISPGIEPRQELFEVVRS